MVESQHEMSVTAFNGLLGEYVEVEEEDDRATLVWEPRSCWIEDPSMSEPTRSSETVVRHGLPEDDVAESGRRAADIFVEKSQEFESLGDVDLYRKNC